MTRGRRRLTIAVTVVLLAAAALSAAYVPRTLVAGEDRLGRTYEVTASPGLARAAVNVSAAEGSVTHHGPALPGGLTAEALPLAPGQDLVVGTTTWRTDSVRLRTTGPDVEARLHRVGWRRVFTAEVASPGEGEVVAIDEDGRVLEVLERW